jgi:translation initiation factor 2B subunit (eIF-2B alpha/beta/delta family)
LSSQALLDYIKNSSATTTGECAIDLDGIITQLKSRDTDTISIMTGCALFKHFFIADDEKEKNTNEPFEEWKRRFVKAGDELIKNYGQFRDRAATNGMDFIQEGMVI